jgi:hypothetical protein
MTTKRLRTWISLALGAGACAQEPAAPAAAGAKPAEPIDYMRYSRVDDERGRLEVQLVRFADAGGREVTLVPAVHVADGAHYDALNQRFATFEKVLYELIADAADRPEPGAEGGALTFVQRAITQGLGVQFQLDRIDYRARNFVHADLTPQEFTRLQEERGESLLTLLLQAMASAPMRPEEADDEQQGGAAAPKPPDIVAALRAGRGPWALKLMLAPQFEQLERLSLGVDEHGEDQSLLLGERNARAVQVLEQELQAGRRRLAIYYGAAHMPDIEQRIRKLGFAPAHGEWLTAWDIQPPPPAPAKRR